MKNLKITIFFILTTILIFGATNAYGQNSEKKKQLFPISITMMNESLSLPFVSSPIQSRYNPAFIIGTEYTLKKRNKYDFHLSGNLGYYYHKDWESSFFTEIRFGYQYNINRFSISSELGIGYAHLFSPKPIYKFKDGQFQSVKDKGRPAFLSSFSIISSFKLSRKKFILYVFRINLVLIKLMLYKLFGVVTIFNYIL